MNKLIIILFFAAVWTANAQDYSNERSIFLNGIDISSARNQKLDKVDIQIDERGNVFITASHYDVLEEGSYVPLSKFSRNSNTAHLHKRPTELDKNMMPVPPPISAEKPVEKQQNNVDNIPVEKPGSDWPDANSQ